MSEQKVCEHDHEQKLEAYTPKTPCQTHTANEHYEPSISKRTYDAFYPSFLSKKMLHASKVLNLTTLSPITLNPITRSLSMC